MRSLAIALGVAISIAGSDARAVVACKTRAGQLVTRTACRPKETQIALADFGVQGPGGAMGAAGAMGRAPLYLLDANGVEIGPVVTAVPDVLVYQPDVPYLHALIRNEQVGGAALIGPSLGSGVAGTVSYESADCTGAALMDASTFMPVLQVIGDAVFRPLQPAGPRTIHSREGNDQTQGCTSVTPRGGCCRTVTGMPTSTLSTTATTTLSALGLHPPFHTSGH